ncbi:hypothetical protein AFULGI_00016260 [Archaeoglobus fulgidus DSM 8774]|uniref:Uncharacterized protein n=1 Tax=Archaeoglobus fulgidus DSM 8774 TaxID=1344584 RepID=A0A075WLD7_ARCFL|nr:hypothetical protein [Archaeoglobus fulgidus]AIG98388.1 hypothetical protein AFULGI_00016260 [Archaeoglobus fulgidus DSM 8774]
MSKLGIEVYKPFVGSSEVARKGLKAVPAFVRWVVGWVDRLFTPRIAAYSINFPAVNRFTHEVEIRDFIVENLSLSKRAIRAYQIFQIAMLSVAGIASAFAPSTTNSTIASFTEILTNAIALAGSHMLNVFGGI